MSEITLEIDGKEVKSQTINVLGTERSRLIPFTWQASSGDHKLEIEVDPEDAIVEIDERNNKQDASLTVGGEGFADILSTREVCSVLPIIFVVVILAIILLVIKKRGSFLGLKPGGGAGEF